MCKYKRSLPAPLKSGSGGLWKPNLKSFRVYRADESHEYVDNNVCTWASINASTPSSAVFIFDVLYQNSSHTPVCLRSVMDTSIERRFEWDGSGYQEVT